MGVLSLQNLSFMKHSCGHWRKPEDVFKYSNSHLYILLQAVQVRVVFITYTQALNGDPKDMTKNSFITDWLFCLFFVLFWATQDNSESDPHWDLLKRK